MSPRRGMSAQHTLPIIGRDVCVAVPPAALRPYFSWHFCSHALRCWHLTPCRTLSHLIFRGGRGEMWQVIDEERYATRRRAWACLGAGLEAGIRSARYDVEKRTIRAKAQHRLEAWAPSRRVVPSMTVLRPGGPPVAFPVEAVALLTSPWPGVFGPDAPRPRVRAGVRDCHRSHWTSSYRCSATRGVPLQDPTEFRTRHGSARVRHFGASVVLGHHAR